MNGELYKGKLDIKSLRAISGQINSKLVVFVEDDFASLWSRQIISSINDVSIDAISFHPMKGDGTAVKVHKNHCIDPAALQKSICIIDGDSEQAENEQERIYRLPGQCPESAVFDNVLENLSSISGELAVSLLKPYEYESQLKEKMESVRNTNRDPHLLYSQLGKKIGFIPEERVKEAFLTIWCKLNLEYISEIKEKLSTTLPKETSRIEIQQG